MIIYYIVIKCLIAKKKSIPRTFILNIYCINFRYLLMTFPFKEN